MNFGFKKPRRGVLFVESIPLKNKSSVRSDLFKTGRPYGAIFFLGMRVLQTDRPYGAVGIAPLPHPNQNEILYSSAPSAK